MMKTDIVLSIHSRMKILSRKTPMNKERSLTKNGHEGLSMKTPLEPLIKSFKRSNTVSRTLSRCSRTICL